MTTQPGQSRFWDWDMCTSGDPLLDLGYLLNQWVEPEDEPAWIDASLMPTEHAGFWRRDQVVQHYAQLSGRDLTEIDWYHAFAAFKFGVVMQQIFIRYHRGQTQDVRFAAYGLRAKQYIDKGCAIAGTARVSFNSDKAGLVALVGAFCMSSISTKCADSTARWHLSPVALEALAGRPVNYWLPLAPGLWYRAVRKSLAKKSPPQFATRDSTRKQ